MLVATFAAIQYTASFGAVPLCPYQFGTGVLLGKPPCWDEPGEDRLNCLTSLPPPPPILLSPVFPCGPSSREWEYFNGKCYYFSLTRMSWYKAKAQCEEMHSQLAIINSYAKQVKTSARGRKAQACPNPAHSPGFLQTPPPPQYLPGSLLPSCTPQPRWAAESWCCYPLHQPAESRQNLLCLPAACIQHSPSIRTGCLDAAPAPILHLHLVNQ